MIVNANKSWFTVHVFILSYYHPDLHKKKRKIVIMVKKLKKIINCPFVLFEIDILIYGNLALFLEHMLI